MFWASLWSLSFSPLQKRRPHIFLHFPLFSEIFGYSFGYSRVDSIRILDGPDPEDQVNCHGADFMGNSFVLALLKESHRASSYSGDPIRSAIINGSEFWFMRLERGN
jgi:hypothetical protein